MSHATGQEMRDAYGESLVALGQEFPNLVVVDADVAQPTRAHLFWKTFPDRFIQLGVAEQNVITFSAGLATMGLIPFANLFACFASQRAGDQVAISVAYTRLNVKIAGCYAGLTTPNTGATHQSVDDIAIMRAMPNLIVVEACDEIELGQAMHELVLYDGPVYLRIVRCALPVCVPSDYRFQLGRGSILRTGGDVTLVASGLMTSRCLEAADALAREGIDTQVVNLSTLKPIDKELVVEAACKTGAIVTAENHSIYGGLGSAVAEVLSEEYPTPLKRVGLQDTFGESGKLPDLLEKFGLTADRVAAAARDVLRMRDAPQSTAPNVAG